MDPVLLTSQFLEYESQTLDFDFKERYVLPGDDVTEFLNKRSAMNKKIILSKGLSENSESRVIVTIAGTLKYRSPSTYWIETKSTFYTPLVGDQVIGIIEDKGSEFYKVNIYSSSYNVTLNRLEFDGATKRNKPELKRGDVIYARVLFTHKDLDTELSCKVLHGPKKDWSSGESIYGDLPENGLLVRLPTSEVRKMLSPECTLLNALGRYYQFEIALGMNGLVWFKAFTGTENQYCTLIFIDSKYHSHSLYYPTGTDTIAIRNALINSTNPELNATDAHINAMVDKLALISKNIKKRNLQQSTHADDDSDD